MKRLSYQSVLKLIVALATVAFFCAYQMATPEPKVQVAQQYQKDLDQFYIHIAKLNSLVHRSVQELPIKKQYLLCREAYKTLEPLFEYYNGIYARNFINGAPLPKLDEGVDEIVVIEPHGLQVLDELIYSDTLSNNINEIIEEVSKLEKHALEISKNNKIKVQDRAVFEACRQELVRIMTLGITGFDTPGSINGLVDSKHAFLSLEKTLMPYMEQVASKNSNLKKRIATTLKKSTAYLSTHTDFDAFDRAYFIKNFINPLYADLLEAQLLLGIETWDEASTSKKSINYNAKNIFAVDFLNPNFYMQLPKEKNKPAVIELGKLLFFDPILSDNNQRACASCHNPQKAFADGKIKSIATDFNGTVLRNSPTLINAVYADKFFYDLRADVLEDQIEHVVVNEKEFHTNYIKIFERIAKSEAYVTSFANAFPEVKNDPINKYSISAALAAYVGSLTALNSSFDQYMRGEKNNLSTEAIRGFNLFAGKAGCATCHFTPIFNGTVPPMYQESESEVLGVPEGKDKVNAKIDTDLGRGNAKIMEQNPIFANSFKTPTVRNIVLTAPYMHNGVYNTLEEVMEFYNNGGGAGLEIHSPNQTLPPDKLNLTQQEIADIIAFMQSLTDTAGTTSVPASLPNFPSKTGLGKRTIGGEY